MEDTKGPGSTVKLIPIQLVAVPLEGDGRVEHSTALFDGRQLSLCEEAKEKRWRVVPQHPAREPLVGPIDSIGGNGRGLQSSVVILPGGPECETGKGGSDSNSKRYRNRLAQRRYRERQRKRKDELEREVLHLTTHVAILQQEIEKLTKEKKEVYKILELRDYSAKRLPVAHSNHTAICNDL